MCPKWHSLAAWLWLFAVAAALGAAPVWRELRAPAVNQRADVSLSVRFGSPDVTLNETSGEPEVP